MVTYPILSVLQNAGIDFELIEHPPVFTVEQGKELLGPMPGAGTKNLFLTDKKSEKFALLFVEESKRVALKELRPVWGWDKVSFASKEHLMELLGVEAGSVTPIAMFSDAAVKNRGKVSFFYDKDLLSCSTIQMHPMINSATIVVDSKKFLIELFESHNIESRGLDIPVVS